MTIIRRKLCIIVPTHWLNKIGGAQYQVKQIVEAAVASGHFEVHVCCRSVLNIQADFDYTLHNIGERSGLSRYAFFWDCRRLLKLLDQIRPDIIYQRVGCAYTGIASYYAARKECRMVWHIAHDNDVDPQAYFSSSHPIMRKIEKTVFEYGIRHADQIIAQTCDQMLALYERYDRDAYILPNFHPEPTGRLKGPHNPMRVIWVANLKRWKRPLAFVHLAEALQDSTDIEFIMVGAPMPNVKGQEAFNSRIAGIRNLTYLGQLSQDQVNGLLDDCHVLVNTSDKEGFSNTFIQAWFRKVPVVTLTVNPDNILETAGIGFVSGSEKVLEENIMLMWKEEKLCQDMGERAREYAINRHSLKNICQLLDIFSA